MQISRRNALLGATAAGAAGVPGAVQGDDAHLEALHAEWRAAEERLVNACEAADAAESRIRDQLPERPLITMGRDWTTKDLFPLTREVIAWHTDSKMPALKSKWDRTLKAFDDWEAECDAFREQTGVAELRRKEAVAHDARRAAFDRFMEAPAQTPRGVLLKFTALHCESEWQGMADDSATWDNVMMLAVRRDLERLAGEARS